MLKQLNAVISLGWSVMWMSIVAFMFGMVLLWAKSLADPDYSIKKISAHHYEVNLEQSITSNYASYLRLRSFLLHDVDESDTVDILLNNYGGSVNSMFLIIDGIVSSKAYVRARVIGPSYSAAAVIACAADEIHFSNYAFLMFHQPRAIGPTGRHIQLDLDRVAALNGVLQYCLPHAILSKEDINLLNSGTINTDVYYKSKEDGESVYANRKAHFKRSTEESRINVNGLLNKGTPSSADRIKEAGARG